MEERGQAGVEGGGKGVTTCGSIRGGEEAGRGLLAWGSFTLKEGREIPIGGMFARRADFVLSILALGAARAQCGQSANDYVVYPGNTPENHPPAEGCMINSKQHGVQNSGPWDPELGWMGLLTPCAVVRAPSSRTVQVRVTWQQHSNASNGSHQQQSRPQPLDRMSPLLPPIFPLNSRQCSRCKLLDLMASPRKLLSLVQAFPLESKRSGRFGLRAPHLQ